MDIAGATGSAYTLTVADVDATVRVLVTATNPDATIVEASEPTAPVLAAGPAQPDAADRQRHRPARADADRHDRHAGAASATPSATSGSPRPTAAPGRTIAGATGSTYAIGVGDVGRYLRLL